VSLGLFQREIFFVPRLVSGGVVVLLAVGAMELVYLCFGCCFFFCFEQIHFIFKSSMEVTFVRVFPAFI
jgi:hypothetical protein